jgi:DNA-directed RNA polymerase beta' subunit
MYIVTPGGCNSRRTVAARGVAGQKKDAARTAFKEKDQGCTFRLFGTNSLKKGAV